MGVKLNPFTGDLQLFNGGGIEWAIQGILDEFDPINGTNIIPIGSLVDGSASTNYSRVDLQEDNPNSWRVGNKLIVPEGLGGWYLITFALSHPTDPVLGSNSQVALGDFRVGIRLNGDTKNQAFSVDAGTGTSEAGSFALPIKLQEADEIEFEFDCNNATNEDFIIRASVIELGGVATTTQTVQVTSIIEENALLALSADQNALNANTVVELRDDVINVTVNNGVTFNNTTHRATLTLGKTYKLQAYVRHNGSASNTAQNYAWWDVTNNTVLGARNQISSLDSPSDDGTQPTASVIITPSTNIDVELRNVGVSLANQNIFSDATHATIEKISENIINTVTAGATDIKLQRVDNDLFETAQFTVEYFSPIQHGRIFGIVFRKYFTIPDITSAGALVNIALGLTPNHVLNVGGYVIEHISGDKILLGTGSGNTASNIGIHVQVQGSNLELDANDSLDWSSGFCWIDYTK